MANIYISSVAYTSVPQWSASIIGDATANGGRGTYVRQLATPAVGSERVFRCTTSGTGGGAEPSWTLTKNGTTTDGSVVWTECTGQEADQSAGVWTAPHARLVHALTATWGAAGDTFYVASDHAETQSSAINATFPGTPASPNKLLSTLVAGGSIPPAQSELSTTPSATFTTTGAAAIVFGGYFYTLGCFFTTTGSSSSAGINICNSVKGFGKFKRCRIALATGHNSTSLNIGYSSQGNNGKAYFDEVDISFSALLQSIVLSNTDFIWRGGALLAGTAIPTELITGSTSSIALIEGVDLSLMSTGKYLAKGNDMPRQINFKDCKLNATPPSVLNLTASTTQDGTVVNLSRLHNSVNYTFGKYAYEGSQDVNTTITKTGGYTDGAQKLSAVLNGNSSNLQVFPFEAVPIAIWNDTVGSAITATIEGIWSDAGAALPKKEDIWCEFEYLGDATSPQGSFASSGNANILITSDCDASVVGWDASPANPVKFKMSATFTPQQKGPIYARIFVGKASSTFYIDPTVVLT